MKTCPKCSKELKDDVKFCYNCGAQVAETVQTAETAQAVATAQTTETVLKTEGGSVKSTVIALWQNCRTFITEKLPEKLPKKIPKKAIMFGGIGLAAAALLILVISLISCGGKSNDNYLLYIKDGEILFSDLKKNSDPWQLTSRLIDSGDIDDEDLAESGRFLSLWTYMSEDGKYIFFPDKVNDNDGDVSLYYRKTTKPEAEAVKIDSDVLHYTVNTSCSVVTYMKGEEGNLYQYKMGEDAKDKIASDVIYYRVSDDGKTIICMNSERSIYIKQVGKEKEKLAGDISYIIETSEDLRTVYYVKDSSLYKHTAGKDREEIASDVYDVLKAYDSGEMYYLTTGGSEETPLMNYVIDDMKQADASITEPDPPEYPDSPDYPSWWDYDTNEEYYAAYDEYKVAYDEWEAECDRLYAEYDAAWDVYVEKYYRDELRAELEEETIEQPVYSLCYYNGKEEIVITDAFVEGYYGSNYTFASDKPVIIYEAYGQSEFKKLKLSEIESIYDVEDMIEEELESSAERYIAVKDKATLVEQQEADRFDINSSGTVIYCFNDISDDDNHGDLYRINVSKNGKIGKAEMYDSDVYAYRYSFINDTELAYFKDYDDYNGDLYIDGKMIDYDVDTDNFGVDTYYGKVFYFTDWSDDREYGTLKTYNGKEAVKISDDVHDFFVTPDNRVIYLYDYSADYCKGELRVWSNGKTRKLDDDVICLFPIIDEKYRGLTYYAW